jgi:DNA topoisomerase-1
VTADGPCIRRIRHGHCFRYVGVNGRPLHDATHLKRIRSLVIPPAWEDVWICPSANGRLQAVGRDARGRKQYRCHPRYRSHQDEAKFSRMMAFGAVRARMSARVERDLRRRGLPCERVLATVV